MTSWPTSLSDTLPMKGVNCSIISFTLLPLLLLAVLSRPVEFGGGVFDVTAVTAADDDDDDDDDDEGEDESVGLCWFWRSQLALLLLLSI